MAIQPNSSPAGSRPRLVGRLVASQALLWMLAAPILGALVARLAVWAQAFWAPLLIFPLLVGCGLGLLLAGLMRLGGVGHRATIWSGAILAAAVAVAGQHYISFLDFESALTAKKPELLSLEEFQGIMPDASTSFAWFMQRQAAQGRPVTAEHVLHGAAAWASWAFDGLLMLIATCSIVYLACQAPYCNHCRSWYRTIRAGRLAADTARRVAEAAAALPIEQSLDTTHPLQYRLSHCVNGCGPGRLELAFRGQATGEVVEAWLSAAQREQVVRVLDGVCDGIN
ncbi:MAG: hypothetical protein ACLP9L_19390 [Thermoguttaceae bacterium]